ncbi:MAG: hypothetical protein KF708_08150 [Pirellulales bacterium]|nr:hypothetical protein [Pirellulales bacterium]
MRITSFLPEPRRATDQSSLTARAASSPAGATFAPALTHVESYGGSSLAVKRDFATTSVPDAQGVVAFVGECPIAQ